MGALHDVGSARGASLHPHRDAGVHEPGGRPGPSDEKRGTVVQDARNPSGVERARAAALVRTAFRLRRARTDYILSQPGSREAERAWREIMAEAPLLETLLLGDGDKLGPVGR